MPLIMVHILSHFCYMYFFSGILKSENAQTINLAPSVLGIPGTFSRILKKPLGSFFRSAADGPKLRSKVMPKQGTRRDLFRDGIR